MGLKKMELKHLEHFTPYHIANIEHLAEFLLSGDIPPPRFDIVSFMDMDFDYRLEISAKLNTDYSPRFVTAFATDEVYNHCGTTACAVGHGPLAGLPALDGEDWRSYSDRVFGCSSRKSIAAFIFMFGPNWTGLNNTAKGTARRMQYFLKHGIPDGIFPEWSKDYVNFEVRSVGVWLEGLEA